MNDVKGRPFQGQIIPWAARWPRKPRASHRELEAMLEKRGGVVNHCMIHRHLGVWDTLP